MHGAVWGTQIRSSVPAQPSSSDSPNCFSIFPCTELQHTHPLSIHHHELLIPSNSFSSTPGCSKPLTSGTTLQMDSEPRQLFFFAELQSCRSAPCCCLSPTPVGKPWDGQWGKESTSGAQCRVGGEGRRQAPSKAGGLLGIRKQDTHLNNSGTNKSSVPGSASWERRLNFGVFRALEMPCYSITRYWQINIILRVSHKVNEESGCVQFCCFIGLALGWNINEWRFWELQVWPLQVE